jgi:hypothetical protein
MRDRYVVAELHGRLGNQLFQFASGYGIARHLDARLVFVSSPVPPRDLLLPRLLGRRYHEADARELLGVGKRAAAGPFGRELASALYHGSRALRRARGRTAPSVTYWANTGRFRPELFALDLPVYVQGHLQTERYFDEYADDVAGAIEWPGDLSTVDLPRPAVGVTFRRGDYEALGWALPEDYYDRAVERVLRGVPDGHLVLFGDDREYVARAGERLRRVAPVVDVADHTDDAITQLRLLSACDHCVIANSSFAWWGAWLGDRYADAPGRVVVAPREYGDGGDRIPARWHAIESGTPSF